MTYLHKVVPTRMIEVTLSSAQTASQGDYVLYESCSSRPSHYATM